MWSDTECVCACLHACVRACVRACVVSVIVKLPALPPCVVDGHSRNPLYHYHYQCVTSNAQQYIMTGYGKYAVQFMPRFSMADAQPDVYKGQA